MVKTLVLLTFIISGTAAMFDFDFPLGEPTGDDNYYSMVQKSIKYVNFEKCPRFLRNLAGFYAQFLQCIAAATPKKLNLCHNLEKKYKCAEPAKLFLEFCFLEESKDVPSYVFDTASATLNFMCHPKYSAILESERPCLQNPYINFCKTKLCNDVFELILQVPTKWALCKSVHEYRQCFERQLTCHTVLANQTIVEFLDAVEKPCGNII